MKRKTPKRKKPKQRSTRSLSEAKRMRVRAPRGINLQIDPFEFRELCREQTRKAIQSLASVAGYSDLLQAARDQLERQDERYAKD